MLRHRFVAMRYSQARSEAEDPVTVELELAPVGVGELAERVLVHGPGANERPLGYDCILAAEPPSLAHR
jgi:hypothetical protein